MNSIRSHNRGMTIIETVVFLSILVLIMASIVSALTYTYKGQRFAFEQADATRSARKGVKGIVHDLREASFADNGAYPIVSIATSSITFYSDYNNDGKIERIHYFIHGTNLRKGVTVSTGDPASYILSNEVTTTISDNIRNTLTNIPLFIYYNMNGTVMTDYTKVGDLAFVAVRLVANLHPEHAPNNFEVRNSAALRNVLNGI